MLLFAGALRAADDNQVAFKVVDGPYFVNNTFEPDARQSFAVLKTLDEFNAMFGVGFVVGGPKPEIMAETFKSQMIAVVVKRGPLVKYEVNSVTRDMNELTIRYSAKANPADSATYASPLIIVLPNADVTQVKFIENRKPVKVLELTK